MAMQSQLEGSLKVKDVDCIDLKMEVYDFPNSRGFQTLRLEMRRKQLAHIALLACK